MTYIYLKGLLLFLLVSMLTPATAQLYTNTFTGVSACPTPGNIPTVAANVSGTDLTRKTMTCMAAANVYNSSNLNNTAAVNENSFIEFSVSSSAGYDLNLTSLSFFIQGSITAPNQLEVRYSNDGFASYTSWSAPNTVRSPGSTQVWNFDDFTASAGETITFRFYPFGTQRADLGTTKASASGTIRLDNVILNGVVSNPMPVKLVAFDGRYTENTILLTWETAWEDQNEGFEIQRSTDAVNFEKAGFVQGRLNTALSSKYEFTLEAHPVDRRYYFRLKQLDKDGHFDYSRIISVISSEDPDSYYTFPNPNKGTFTLSASEASPENIKLFDKYGKEIKVLTIRSEHDHTFQIHVGNTTEPGLYFLKIKDKGNPLKVLIEN